MEAGNGGKRSGDGYRGRPANTLEAASGASTSSYLPEVEPYEVSARHSISRPGYALRYHGVSEYRLGIQARHPVPPPYGCFSVPKFQFYAALESVLALVFINSFWVGLWDLLNNTVFPVDRGRDMYGLIVVGVILLYFTNALYEPPHPALPTPRTRSEKRDRDRPAQSTVAYSGARETPGGSGKTGRMRLVNTSRRLMARLHPLFDPVASLDIREGPFIPPRFEFWRLMERVIASFGSVFVWVGIWDQIDMNLLPLVCSYKACGDCTAYGTFPCAWYKIAFTVGGLVGMYFTRSLYQDHEVSYSARGAVCWQCSPKQDEKEATS